MKQFFNSALAALALCTALPAAAQQFIPVGVQTSVPVDTVLNDWGWSIAYQGSYDDTVPVSDVFAGVDISSPETYLMYAARPVGSNTFTLLAAAPAADVLTVTPFHTTTSSNGAEWYYNSWSMGFAGGGDAIDQSTADIMDSNLDDFAGINGDLRLSWHTEGPGSGPDFVDNGWRAGVNTNTYAGWERLVLVATVPVPEPSAALLGLTAAAGMLLRRRRRFNQG